jgi:peptidoglycan/LPS O-acetylase OafA/YrhL
MRLHYIDWLRILIISMVVAHHAGHAYATMGGAWPIYDVERTALLSPFFAVNAAFGMGLFFFISGSFVPGSLARKGVMRFIRDRVVRLGIPLVVIGFGVFALIGYGNLDGERSFWTYYRNTYIGEWTVEFGHLWFAFHLLLYSILYAVLATVFPVLTRECDGGPVGHAALIGLVLLIAVAGGLTRLAYPQDVWIKLLWIVPTEPAHLPQYVLMFAVGTIAGRYGWFESFPRIVGIAWLRIGLLAAALCYALVYLDSFGGIRIIDNYIIAVIYPIWEAILCVGLSVGITTYAREYWGRSVALLPTLAGATYGVYIFHVFVVIGFNIAFLDIALPPFVKFLLVTMLTLITTFPAVILFRKIPLVSRAV